MSKLIFPTMTLEELGLAADEMRFQLGTDQGKRKIKALYLIATDSEEAFSIVRTGCGYALPLGVILSKGGIEFSTRKYIIHDGSTASALEISEEQKTEKAPYTGKLRGRKW